MSDWSDLFDSYGRNARLFPAILVLTPILVLPVVLLGTERISSYVILGVVAAAGLYPMSAAIRDLGKKVEPKLYAEWGDKPTTRMLLWEDSTFDATAKARYYGFFRAQGLDIPSPDYQKTNPGESRKQLSSAVDWLRENRRANSLVLGENASYGFRRNLFAAKWIGVATASLAGIVNLWSLGILITSPAVTTFADFRDRVEIEDIVGLVLDVCLLLFFLSRSKSWVKRSADIYARAILLSCDQQSES